MTVPMPYIPPSIYLLADNLDAALAAGEDLTQMTYVWMGETGPEGAEIARQRSEEREQLGRIRRMEEVLVARILRSRERAEEIGRRDQRFGPIARLYTSGTVQLIDSVSEFGDTTLCDFETADGALAYLRSRGLVDTETPAPQPGATLSVTEEFLVARRMRLGSLMDLAAMFLDALEVHYDLFDPKPPPSDLLPGETPLAEDGVPTAGEDGPRLT